MRWSRRQHDDDIKINKKHVTINETVSGAWEEKEINFFFCSETETEEDFFTFYTISSSRKGNEKNGRAQVEWRKNRIENA